MRSPTHRRTRSALLGVAVLAFHAHAQVVEGFDTPRIFVTDTPPGPFIRGGLNASLEPQTLSVTLDGGAHRGPGALLITDGNVGTGAHPQSIVLLGANDTGDRHARFWFRMQPDGGTGTVSLLSFISPAGTTAEPVVVQKNDSLSIRVQCVDADGGTAFGGDTPIDTAWHLVELSTLRMGSRDGACSLAVDGVNRVTLARDYSSQTISLLVFGLPYANDELTGNYWFDDFAYTQVRQPATVRLTAVAQGTASQCVAVGGEFIDSTGAVSPLPHSSVLRFAALNADLFAEDACSTALSTSTLDAGLSTFSFSFRPRVAGRVSVTVEPDDAWPATLEYVARGTESLAVGCGCSEAPSTQALAVLVAWWLRRRRINRIAATFE